VPRARLPVGKLPAAHLEVLLAGLAAPDDRLLVGPRPGEDAAVIALDADRALVAATDPVTFATDRIGAYAVHVNANDVAVLGARPRWFFAVVLLPEAAATAELALAIAREIRRTCDALGATVAGGHTEITAGLDRPIVVGQMLGEVATAKLVRKTRLSPGDLVLVTHGAAIEGTAILARERRDHLSAHLTEAELAAAARLLDEPGISVVRAALTAVEAADVHAMHDPTEGGLAAGLVELAQAGGCGLRVFGARVPVLPETRAVCRVLGLDPWRLIASGALLVAAAPGDVDTILAALREASIPATVVAEVRPAADGLSVEWDGRTEPLLAPARDEIARLFDAGA
jgi:hydrogenase expression/formation protein HypE